MDDLIERLEKATEGSKDLDAEIFCLTRTGWTIYGALNAGCPAYTTSIDAALTLVPEGWRLSHIANVTRNPGEYHEGKNTKGSLALAICIAALKARKATND